MHGVAYGAPPRRHMNDMTTDYYYDAYAASYDAQPRAADDVEGRYVPGRVSDGYTRTTDAPGAELRRVKPATASLLRDTASGTDD